MSVSKYILHCMTCGYKRWTDGSDVDDLIPVETCKSCSGGKQYKCPKCGYLIKPRKFIDPPNPSKHIFKRH